jgi:hypothetical protein
LARVVTVTLLKAVGKGPGMRGAELAPDRLLA